MNKKCVNCTNEFKCVVKTKNKKYCDICRIEIWKNQKRDWHRKKVGKYGKPRVCILCKIEFEDEASANREYCVNCAILRDKVLHHTSYKKRSRKTLKENMLLVR